MDMCKIRCKIVKSQLTVFKKKKERKSSYMNQYTLIQKLHLLTSLKLIRKARRNIVEKVPARSDDIGQISLGYLHNRDQP